MYQKLKIITQKLIFNSRWLLIPFLLKLIYTLILLGYHFIYDGHVSNEILMETLEAVDTVMIACLVKMIITGSYHAFIDKNHGYGNESVSSGLLKIKLATSILGVTSVHLLQTFIKVGEITNDGLHEVSMDIILKQVIIYGTFMVGALVFAIIDYLHCKTEKH